MLLEEHEIQQAMERARIAFPKFTDWEYNNEINESYLGFSLWGQFILDPDELMSRCYYITFDTHKENWSGYLSIGQHSYFWTSANVGDARLLATDNYGTLEDAIEALKAEMARLFSAFSVVGGD